MNKGYGFDRLSRDVLILSTALSAVGVIAWRSLFGMILCATATLLTALILYRTLSDKIERRQDELIGYENLIGAIKGFFGGIHAKVFKKSASSAGADTVKQQKDPAYRYFKCPKCKREYRAPKGNGKIRVTCKECGEQFEKRV